MGGGLVATACEVEPYQLVFVKNSKAVHPFWGNINTAFEGRGADKKYFLIYDKTLLFFIQFGIKFTKFNEPIYINIVKSKKGYLLDKI